MKLVLIVFTIVLSTFDLLAQLNCDIATDGIMASSLNVSVGQTSDLTFKVYNKTPIPMPVSPCTYAVNSVEVRLSLPQNGGIEFQSIILPFGGTGSYFTWTYNSGTKVLRGINHTAISLSQEEIVTVRVVGTALLGYPQSRSVVLNIVNNFLGPPFLSNDPDNDNDTETLINLGPLPIELISFEASSKKCNKVDLVWETSNEKNNDYMEILRSSDGRDFQTIGKVKGTNSPHKSTYSFIDENKMVDGETYYYRLKQVDFDGHTEFHKIVLVEYNCQENGLNMELYPNPAFDKVWVGLKGFNEKENVKIFITNNSGELVKTIHIDSIESLNEISVNDLTPGLYNIVVMGYEELLVKRFIKVD